jgi:hypothetical protein
MTQTIPVITVDEEDHGRHPDVSIEITESIGEIALEKVVGIIDELKAALADTMASAPLEGFALDNVKFELAVTGSGSIGLLGTGGKAEGKATVSVTFARRGS